MHEDDLMMVWGALKKATASAIEWQPDQLLTVKYMFYDEDRELILTSQLKEAMAAYMAAGHN